MFGFLKRGETSGLGKRRRLLEHELLSPPQQQDTPLNPLITISSFCLKWNVSLSLEDIWRDIFLQTTLLSQ